MTTADNNAESSRQNRLLRLITSVATGDAAREDVVTQLREANVDALDVLVEVLAQATQNARVRYSGARPIDPQRFAGSGAPSTATSAGHRPPSQPFLLRGTLYDPQDITRFDGTDLHVVVAPGRDELLAFDDRTVMETWWHLSYVSATLASSDSPLTTLKAETTQVHPSTITRVPQPGRSGVPDPSPSSGPESFVIPTGPGPAPIIPHTNFWEHINFEGSRIELKPGWEYNDLTEVAYTFFGTGDWNDTISSVQLVATRTAVLWEHINRGGSSLTITTNVAHLDWWNDRASSCATW